MTPRPWAANRAGLVPVLALGVPNQVAALAVVVSGNLAAAELAIRWAHSETWTSAVSSASVPENERHGFAYYAGRVAPDAIFTAVTLGESLIGSGVAELGALARGGLEAAAEGTVGVMPAARAGASLAKQLASEAQLGEMAAGTGTRIAGTGARAVFRDAGRIAQTYGGNAADWVKMSSSGFRAADGTTFATHWVENIATGQQVEQKVVIDIFGGP